MPQMLQQTSKTQTQLRRDLDRRRSQSTQLAEKAQTHIAPLPSPVADVLLICNNVARRRRAAEAAHPPQDSDDMIQEINLLGKKPVDFKRSPRVSSLWMVSCRRWVEVEKVALRQKRAKHSYIPQTFNDVYDSGGSCIHT